MLAVSIIVLSVDCGHYSLFSDYPIPSLLLLLLLMQLRTHLVQLLTRLPPFPLSKKAHRAIAILWDPPAKAGPPI